MFDVVDLVDVVVVFDDVVFFDVVGFYGSDGWFVEVLGVCEDVWRVVWMLFGC